MASKKTTSIKEEQQVSGLQLKLEEKLSNYCGVTPKDASIEQMYKAVALTVLDELLQKKIVLKIIPKQKQSWNKIL